MRGTTNITSHVTYTQSTGAISIPGAQVTGVIGISATAVPNKYALTNSVSNATITASGANALTHDTTYTGTLNASTGWVRPVSITVMRGNTNISNSVTYNQSTGAISIPGTQVTAAITISGTTQPASYTVVAPTNTTLTNTAAQHGVAFNATLNGNTGWARPASITMTRDNVSFTNFTYNNVTGAISIVAAHVTGNFRITATVPRAQYSVINSVSPTYSTTITNSGTNAATHGTQWVGTITAQTGRILPPASGVGTITVTVGGTVLTTNQFTYSRTNDTTGSITIPTGNVTGEIVIRGTTSPVSYTISAPAFTTLTNTTIWHGNPYNATLNANPGLIRPLSITMTRNGTSFTNFTYNNGTGAISIDGLYTTGNFVISGAVTQVLPAPTVIAAESVTTTSFRARWGRVDNASHYLLDISTTSNFSSFLPGYNGRKVGNNTNHLVVNLSPGTTYFYRVRAENTNSVSLHSGVQPVTTSVFPLLMVSPARLSVSPSSTNREIHIVSNRSWTITSSDRSWVRASQVSGSNSETILVTIDNNPDSNGRSAKITVDAGGLKQEVEIIQEGTRNNRKNVSVAFYYHRTYRDAYGDYAQEARSMLNDANRAFLTIHNVNLTHQTGRFVSVNMPMDNCGHHSILCRASCCGDHQNHMKDASRNLNYFKDEIFNSNHSRLGVFAYRSLLCTVSGNGSHGAVSGRAHISGRTSIANFIPSQYEANVRVLQHEIAHNFGVKDGYSSASGTTTQCHDPTQTCIMDSQSALIWDTNYGSRNTWCSVHRAEFSRNLH